MGFAESPFKTKNIGKFDWKDLNDKILKIKVIEPNPECLEFVGQVCALDVDTMTIYILHEWDISKRRTNPKGGR